VSSEEAKYEKVRGVSRGGGLKGDQENAHLVEGKGKHDNMANW